MKNEFNTTLADLPLGPGVEIIASNEDGLFALDKPAAVLSHPNEHGDRQRSILTAHYNYQEERFRWEAEDGTQHCVWLINRLDSGTSGVILLALNEEVAMAVKKLFGTHHVTKTYIAVVKGKPTRLMGTWNDRLQKDVYRNGKRVKGGQKVPARSTYQSIRSPQGGFPISLMRLQPITGRTHQLRAQCKMNRHPIVGDRTYGSFSFNREVYEETGVKRMLLHSQLTSVRYSLRGKAQHFEAKSEVPEAFNQVMGYRPGWNYGYGVGRQRVEQAAKEAEENEEASKSERVLAERRFKI